MSKSLPFLLIPALSKEFSPKEYGIVMNFQALTIFASYFAGFNSQSYILVYFYSIEEKIKKLFVGNILVLGMISVLLMTILSFTISGATLRLIDFDRYILWFILIGMFFENIINININQHIVNQEAIMVSKLRILKLIIELTTTILFIYVFSWGYLGRILSITLSSSIVGLYLLAKSLIENKVKLNFDKVIIAKILRYSLPLIPHELSSWIKAGYDKIFIAFTFGVYIGGIYALSFQISSAMLILIVSFNNAFVPIIYKKLSGNYVESKIVKMIYFYFIFVTSIFILLLIAVPLIYEYFVSMKFIDGKVYSIIILVGMLFKGYYYAIVNLLLFKKRSKVLAIITLTSSIIYLVLSYFLSKIYGIEGMFFSYIFSEIFAFLMVGYFINYYFPLPWVNTFKLFIKGNK